MSDDWSNDLNGDPWGPKTMLELIFLDKDCEAGRNTLLVYYPKYPLICEIYAVAICDSGYSEERTLTLHCPDSPCTRRISINGYALWTSMEEVFS